MWPSASSRGRAKDEGETLRRSRHRGKPEMINAVCVGRGSCKSKDIRAGSRGGIRPFSPLRSFMRSQAISATRSLFPPTTLRQWINLWVMPPSGWKAAWTIRITHQRGVRKALRGLHSNPEKWKSQAINNLGAVSKISFFLCHTLSSKIEPNHSPHLTRFLRFAKMVSLDFSAPLRYCVLPSLMV